MVCFGIGVTRFCCPCSKSNLQNCKHVAGATLGSSLTRLITWSYKLASAKHETELRICYGMIALAIISLLASFVLFYGYRYQIKWMLHFWNITALLQIVVLTIIFLVILPVGYWTLSIILFWAIFIFGILIVQSGIEEIVETPSEVNLQNEQGSV